MLSCWDCSVVALSRRTSLLREFGGVGLRIEYGSGGVLEVVAKVYLYLLLLAALPSASGGCV
jgi:hypothetical protein